MEVPHAAAQILAAKGKKLHAHEMSLSRTDNGSYIARHELRDKHGNPPNDGQRSSKIYALNSTDELAQHVQQHMAAPEPDEDDAEG